MLKNFKQLKRILVTSFLCTAFIPELSHAGTKIEFDLNKAEATIHAKLIFFGDIDDGVASLTRDKIAKQWQGQPSRTGDTDVFPLAIIYRGRLSVHTDITYEVIPTLDEAKKRFTENHDPSLNFIRVTKRKRGITSTVLCDSNGKPGNVGIFSWLDLGPDSTTPIHEFGHLLGLGEFPNGWTKKEGRFGPPSIMLQRNMGAVDPEYLRNPNDPTTGLNPTLRRVREQDTLMIPIENFPVFYSDPNHLTGYFLIGRVPPVEHPAVAPLFKEKVKM